MLMVSYDSTNCLVGLRGCMSDMVALVLPCDHPTITMPPDLAPCDCSNECPLEGIDLMATSKRLTGDLKTCCHTSSELETSLIKANEDHLELVSALHQDLRECTKSLRGAIDLAQLSVDLLAGANDGLARQLDECNSSRVLTCQLTIKLVSTACPGSNFSLSSMDRESFYPKG
jgi:hypothetical protein